MLGAAISYSIYLTHKMHVPDFHVYDLRHTETGYIIMNVSWYDVSKDVMEKTLYAFLGYQDGKYIFDYYTRGRTEKLTANEWIKTPSGREFMVDTKTPTVGVNILIK